MKIKTSSDIKKAVEQAGNETFFSRNSMRFAGDTMRNLGVRQPVEVTTRVGEKVMAYQVFRRKPVKGGLKSSFWFNAETFDAVYPGPPHA